MLQRFFRFPKAGGSNKLTKWLRVVMKVIGGVFVFYLVLVSVIVPLILVVAVPRQGSKFLKTPVKLRSVFFHPFLWQLHINGFAILDQQQQPMVGFDKLSVDVSFTNLFKKIYRVESVELEGLSVHTVLLPDGNINLLALVPPAPAESTAAAETQVVPEEKPGATPAESQPATGTEAASPKPLPLVMIDRIGLIRGEVCFTDQSVQPNFSTCLNDMETQVTGFSTNADAQTKVIFQSKLDGKGTIAIEALVKPLAKPLALETSFALNNYVMQILTPYVGKYTGRSLADGKLDVKMVYRIDNNQLTASHKLLIQRFEFGQKVESKDALPLPFGLAVALLEDPQGKINIALPVTGDMSDPEFEYWPLVGQVVRNFFMKLVTSPFSALASMMGGGEAGTDELGYVKFVPGRSDLSDEEKQKLETLAKGLNDRPKLRLEVDGSYDPPVDWKAIQADMFTKDYEELRKQSTRSDGEIYQMLYQRRFGIRGLWDLAKKYKASMGDYDEEKFNAEMKRQLIESAPPDQAALAELGKARAQVVYDFLLAAGFDAQRLNLGQARSTQSSMGFVPLEFTLTVFGESSE